MLYRLGRITVDDPVVGRLELEGDGFVAAGEAVGLAVNTDVQRHLGMSPTEVAEAARIMAQHRDTLRAAAADAEAGPPHRQPSFTRARTDAEDELARLLGPDRATRLRRLSWRIRRGAALLDDEVARALGLTDAQRDAINRAMDVNEQERQQLFREIRAVRLQSPADLQERAAKYEEAGDRRLLEVLTPDQRRAFGELTKPAPP